MTESSMGVIRRLLEQDILKDCPEPTDINGCCTWKISPELSLSIVSDAPPQNSEALIFLKHGVEVQSVLVCATISSVGPHTVRQLINSVIVNTLTIHDEVDVVQFFKGCIQNIDLII